MIVGTDGIVEYAVVLLLHHGGRAHCNLLADSRDQRPSDCRQRSACHIILCPVRFNLRDIGTLLKRIAYKCRQFLILRLPQINALPGNMHLERSFRHRRKKHMSILIDDTLEAAVLIRQIHGVLQVVQEQVRSDNRNKLSVMINGK